MNFLKKIIDEKKQEVLSDKKITPVQNLKKYCKNKNFKFSKQIKQFNNYNKPAIIAEIKQASPSKGIIKKNFDHMKIAEEYVNNDAACLSILTEKNYFLGNKKYVSDIKSKFDIPILNKDFFVDPYQVYEANKNGADCILIILNSSSDQLIKDLLFVAKEMEMDVVMEVHNHKEMEIALKYNCSIIGINNRDLETFNVSLENTITLYNNFKTSLDDKIIISESGINTSGDIKKIYNETGINNFLIGESFMKSESITDCFKNLLNK